MGMDLPTLQDVSCREEGRDRGARRRQWQRQDHPSQVHQRPHPHIYPGEYSGRVVARRPGRPGDATYELAKKIGFLFQNPENQIFMFTVERDISLRPGEPRGGAVGDRPQGGRVAEAPQHRGPPQQVASASSPTARSSGWPSPGLWPWDPSSWCSTSPPHFLTRGPQTDVVALVKELNASWA